MNKLLLLIPMFSSVIYHVGQKKLRGDIAPFTLFTIVYLVAGSLLLLAAFINQEQVVNTVKNLKLNDLTALAVIIIGIVGVELGFLMAYRTDLPISFVSMVTNIGIGVSLLIVGKVFFQEAVNLRQVLGVILSLIGILLIAK